MAPLSCSLVRQPMVHKIRSELEPGQAGKVIHISGGCNLRGLGQASQVYPKTGSKR